MAKSIKQLQEELLSSGALDKVGANKSDYQELKNLPLLEQLLIQSAANFIIKVKENIEVLGLTSSGSLSDDLSEGELEKTPQGYSITVGYPANKPASKYYDFVNKGVRGVESGTPNSKYSFKNKFPSKKMALNLLLWVRKNNIRGNDVVISRGQRKKQSLTKMANEATKKKSLAYAIAVNIKKKGLKQTRFFDNAIDSYFKDFNSTVAKVIGQDIKLSIREEYGNNSK